MVIKIYTNSYGPQGVADDFAWGEGKIVFRPKRYKAECTLKNGGADVGVMDMATTVEWCPSGGQQRVIGVLCSKFDDDSRPDVGVELVIGAGEYSVSAPAAVDAMDPSEKMQVPGKLWTFTK